MLVPAWYRNEEKRLTKRPRVHFLDPGIRRSILGRRGSPDGADVESAVAAEIVKCVRAQRIPVALHHLRTHDQREVDKPVLACVVLSQDLEPRRLVGTNLPPTWAVPIPLLLG